MIKENIMEVNEEFFHIRDELKNEFKRIKRDRSDML